MDKNVWLGALLTAGIGFCAWLGIQMVNSYKELRQENRKLKDEQEKVVNRKIEDLVEKLNLNTLAVVKLDVKLANVEKFGGMLYSLSNRMDEFSKWKDSSPAQEAGDPDKDS